MKKSKFIPLLMLGTLITACSDDNLDTANVQVKQNTYATMADCQADWGPDDTACQPQPRPQTTQSHGSINPIFMYMGPRYYFDSSTSTPMMIGSNGVARAVTAPIASTITGGGISGRASSVSTSSESVSRGGFGGSAHAGGGEGGGG